MIKEKDNVSTWGCFSSIYLSFFYVLINKLDMASQKETKFSNENGRILEVKRSWIISHSFVLLNLTLAFDFPCNSKTDIVKIFA